MRHDISWKAEVRLGQRDRPLSAHGTHEHQVVVAMARALIDFMGAMARHLSVTPESRERMLASLSVLKGALIHRQRRRPGVGSSAVA